MQRLSEFGSRRWPQMVAGAAMLAAAGSAVAAVRLKRQAESDLGPEDDLVTNGSGEWRGATRTADRGYGPPPPEPPYEEPLPGPPPPGPGPAYGPPPGGPPLGSDDIPPPPGGGDIPPGGRGPIPPSGPIPPGR